MSFPTPAFALFMLVLLPLWHALSHHPRARQALGLAASGAFLLYSGPAALAVGLGMACWAAALAQASRSIAPWLWRVALSTLLLPLAYFKYGAWLGLEAWAWHGPLPLGLSFYTFSSLAWVLTARDGSYVGGPLAGASGAFFMPTLGAGPVCRPKDAAEQLQRPMNHHQFTSCAAPFILGLFLKLVISTRLGSIADEGFTSPGAWTFFGLCWSTHAYAGQLYADFAGYSLMAIGVGRALGVELPSNFASPYLACSISDFWRRWHISLSTFWRDRIYIPLGGSRAGRPRELGALMAVMLLCGLWHGAGLSFLLWGAIHGVMLCTQRCWGWIHAPRLPRWLGLALTFECVCWAWLPFRVTDMSQLVTMGEAAWTAPNPESIPVAGGWMFWACWVALALEHIWGKRLLEHSIALGRRHLLAFALLATLSLLACVELSPEGIPPFIYANF